MNKKQKTLFQSWNKTSSAIVDSSNHTPRLIDRNVTNTEQTFTSYNLSAVQSSSSPFQPSKCSKTVDLADPEFDYEAGKTWIYPTNYSIRDYQFSIVQEALYKNTLVVLPTGLGKTFIAAVVMYNIYRWFPNGKVVFMAPTKPLVAQQVDACFNITGIPQEDTTQMTGTNAPDLRKRMWQKKRVFFLTPQVLVNDLVRNICPATSIKCLVIDEAHKALGNHAYCQVIKELCSYTSDFRVLALTATPGSETQFVKQVLSNLLISHVEMRTEDSEDVQQYTHTRCIEKIVVPLGGRLNNLKSRFLDVINIYLKRLANRKAISARNPASLSKYQMLTLRQAFSQHPPSNIDKTSYGIAMADFSLCISLYHAYELLLMHGATSFYNFLSGILNGDKSIPHSRSELMKNFEFEEIMRTVKDTYIPEPIDKNAEVGNRENRKRKVLPGHPKLDKLLEVVLHHFERKQISNITDTRVMVFTQYRDSVQEIVDMLDQYQPTIKVMSFIGQSSKSSSNVGYSQKLQLKVIQQFRSGGYNTLVSTCVGEEGLDIGEVDLIVCYDCPKSPIRLVQRMGRTGRLREGRIILLLAEGKEEQMYNTCEYRKKSVHRAITKGFSFAQFYQNSPSLIPPGVKPICVKTVVTIKPKKIISLGVSKSPFLNEEEMLEFNKHVKVPHNEVKVLPKQELIILKKHNQGVAEEEASSMHPEIPQLSLSDWTLWQTTPQRTDMIPHSSKSLLLVKILEFIHFPELLPSNKSLNTGDFTDFFNNSGTTSKAKDLCSWSFLKQSKITEVLSASKTIDENDDIEIISLPEEICEVISPNVEVESPSKCLPLIQQLFNATIPKCFKVISDLKSPPSTVKVLSIDEFSSVDIKNFVQIGNNSASMLHILNKKMKAKLKRKSKELNRSVFCKDSQIFPTHLKSIHSPTKSEKLHSSLNISSDNLHKSEPKQLENVQKDPEGIIFDIDFDLPDVFGDDLDFNDNDVSDANALPDSSNKNNIATKNEKDMNSHFCPNEELQLKTSQVELEDFDQELHLEDFDIDFLIPEEESIGIMHSDMSKLPSISLTENGGNDYPGISTCNKSKNLKITDGFVEYSKVSSNKSQEKLTSPLKDAKSIVPINEAKLNNTSSDANRKHKQYKNKDSELKKIDKSINKENVNLNFSKANNVFQNIPLKNSEQLCGTNLDVSPNCKKRKLSLNELTDVLILYESDKKLNSKTITKSSTDRKLSFQPDLSEKTEIYKHSFIDKLEENSDKCNFDVDFLMPESVNPINNDVTKLPSIPSEFGERNHLAVSTHSESKDLKMSHGFVEYSKVSSNKSKEKLTSVLNETKSACLKPINETELNNTSSDVEIKHKQYKNKVSELKKVDKSIDIENVNLNFSKANNVFENVSPKSKQLTSNTSLDISSNYKKSKLSLNEFNDVSILYESGKKLNSKTITKSSTDRKLSFQPDLSEKTEIYKHSFIDKLEENSDKCNFDVDFLIPESVNPINNDVSKPPSIPSELGERNHPAVSTHSESKDLKISHGFVEYSKVSSNKSKEKLTSVLNDTKSACLKPINETKLNNTSSDVEIRHKQYKNKVSELKKVDKSIDIENVNLNFSKANNVFENVSPKRKLLTSSTSLDISNCKKSKLSLNELNDVSILYESDKKLNSKTITRSSSDRKLSFQPDLSEKTEIYKHSFIDKIEVNSNECNFDFDVSFGDNDTNDRLNHEFVVQDVLSKSTKVCSLSKNLNVVDDLEEFDKDANTILEQLFTSQKNISKDLNSSFSSQLTVKRCISETDNNSVNKKKRFKTSLSSCNIPKSSNRESNVEKLNYSVVFQTQNQLKSGEMNNSSKDEFSKIENLSEDASQYTLTQLLSLIDCTEKVEKDNPEKSFNKSSHNLQKDSEIINPSSDDEVCPTPPKEVIKPKSKFIYSKKSVFKSLNFDEHLQEKALQNQFKSSGVKETVNFDNCYSEQVEKTRCDNRSDSVTALGCEMNEKEEIVELELSPKITFDVSFDLPFTQEDFENSKDQNFDMNNAIIESSPSEGKLNSNPDNDSVESVSGKKKILYNLLNEMPSNRINMFPECPNEEDDCLFDEYSESLLPEKLVQVDNNTAIPPKSFLNEKNVSNNLDKNSKVYNFKSFDALQGSHKQSSKSNPRNVVESSDKTRNYSNENCVENLTNGFPSNKQKENSFKDSIFFKLISEDCLPSNIPNTSSESIQSSKIYLEKEEPDFKSAKDILLCNNKANINGLRQSNPSSNSLQFSDSISNIQSDSKSDKEKQNDDLYNKIENHFKDSTNTSKKKQTVEAKQPDFASRNVFESNINPENHTEMSFSEEKLCFDLSFDDQTCDILSPKNSPNILENMSKTSNIQSDLQTRESSDQNCVKNSLSFKECCPQDYLSEKSIYKNAESNDISNKCVEKLNAVNDEIVWEFDLDDDGQSFKLELEKNKQSLHGDQESTVFNAVGNSSSDEFDLHNSNQIMKQKKPNQVPKPVSEKSTKASIVSISEIGAKGNNQACSSKNGLSSKLSVKDKIRTTTVLKEHSVIEDEEDDFQFIKQIHKKIDKPSTSKNKQRKALSYKNEFLLSQAQVSGSENSGFESAGDADGSLEGSFIDDDSPQKMECTDQHAFYLKSIKDCVGLPQKFKLKTMKNDNLFPDTAREFSMYQYDSFCVNDEDVAFLSSDNDMECSPPVKTVNKARKVKGKNAKKRLKRIITHDSTSSSEHETSPKVSKISKEIFNTSDVPDNTDNDCSIIMRKQRPKLVIISSDEGEETVFVRPLNPKPQEKTAKIVSHNVDLKASSATPTLDSSENEKLEFTINFCDDVDFLPPTNKKVVESSTKTSFLDRRVNHNESNVSNLDNYPSTSKAFNSESSLSNSKLENLNRCIKSSNINKSDISTSSTSRAVDCDSNSIVNNTVRTKMPMKLNDLGIVNTISSRKSSNFQSMNKGDSNYAINNKIGNTISMKISNPNDIKTLNCTDSSISNNIPSTSRSVNCNSNSVCAGVEIADIDVEYPNISFSIGWDEICPISNVVESSSMIVDSKNKSTSPSINIDKEAASSVILVDSRELASGKPVISALRNVHKVNPVVMQLQCTDYILSNRLAVERILDSEFSNCPMPPKIVEKVKEMADIYERSVVIIEKDNRKHILSFNKNVTKYLQFVVCVNCNPSIKVLFSKSVEQTSELISDLIRRERKRGFHINVPVALNAKNKNLFDFYSSFPKISPICALNFMYYFPTVELFLKSSVEDLKKKGSISSHKALSISNYIKNELTFHEKM